MGILFNFELKNVEGYGDVTFYGNLKDVDNAVEFNTEYALSSESFLITENEREEILDKYKDEVAVALYELVFSL